MAHILPGMAFPQQLTALRKAKGLTQAECAQSIGVSVPQFQRYEGGKSQPTLDVIKNIAKAFNVPADVLIFDEEERGPSDDLRLQFEAVSHFDEEKKRVVMTILESMIIKHEADKWNKVRSQPADQKA